MTTSQILVTIGVIAFILFIFILTCIISYRRSSKVIYKRLLKMYEYNHGLLAGQIIRILNRIEIITHNNTSYIDKYLLLNRHYMDVGAKDVTLDKTLRRLKELLDKKNYNEFKSVLKNNNALFSKFNKVVSYLNKELLELIRPEEECKKEEEALFETYQEIKSNYSKKRHNYSHVDQSFQKLFEALEHQFNKVDDRLNHADYDEVKYILKTIKSTVSNLPALVKELPQIVERVVKTIPNKLKELERKYDELISKDFPLSYLNVESTIDTIRKTLIEIDKKLIDLKIKDINQTLDNIESKIDELLNTLIEEERAKNEFDEIYSSIIITVNKTDKEYVAIKSNIDKFQKIYLVDKDHENKLINLKTLVDKIEIDKRNIELQLHYNGQTPYSYLINVAKGLEENAKKTYDLLTEIKTYQLASKEICEKAYNLLEPTYHKVKLLESELSSLLQPQLDEKYKTSIERTYILMENINRSINNIPIDVKKVEELTTELSSIHQKVFIEIDNLLAYQKKARDAILYINRERMNYSDINSLLLQAEKHYTQGEYKLAFDLTSFILEKLTTRLPKSKKAKKFK